MSGGERHLLLQHLFDEHRAVVDGEGVALLYQRNEGTTIYYVYPVSCAWSR